MREKESGGERERDMITENIKRGKERVRIR